MSEYMKNRQLRGLIWSEKMNKVMEEKVCDKKMIAQERIVLKEKDCLREINYVKE